MKINIFLLRELLIKILLKKGFSQEDSELIAGDYWEAEVSGKKTHGITKFYKELAYINDKEGDLSIIVDRGSMVLIDAKKQVGALAANKAVDLLIERSKKYGVSIVGMKNAQRYGSLSYWSSKIAKSNLIGIVVNSCEPAVVPYGGTSPVLGTNPISVAIPTSTHPILLDMATAKSSMSKLLLSLYNNEPLDENTFLNDRGNFTTELQEVKAVESFGDYKGFGLGIIVQVLSGSLMTAEMGSRIKSHYDYGYFFQAIDPTVFQDIKSFKQKNDTFIKEIKRSKRKKGVKEILIPGERSLKCKLRILNRGEIEVSPKIYELLTQELTK